MRTASEIESTAQERQTQMRWSKANTVSVRRARRVKIVLPAVAGKGNKEIAQQLGAVECKWADGANGLPKVVCRRLGRICRAADASGGSMSGRLCD